MLRLVAGAVGGAILFATAHLTISKTTGYQDAHALLVLAIAAGVGTGALAVGKAWSEWRWFLCLLLSAAMICGELFGLLQTGDRITAERERMQAPAREKVAAHNRAAKEVADLRDKLTAMPATSDRLTAALVQKQTADAAAISKASEKGCATNCRALLEAQVTKANAEVDAARSDLAQSREAVEQDLKAAEIVLATTPLPASGTPLADRLGVDASTLDLIGAALGALGANGLAACLLAFAAHGRRNAKSIPSPATVAATKSQSRQKPVKLLAAPSARQHAAEFSIRCLKPSPGKNLPLTSLHARYAAWCKENDRQGLKPADLARELGSLFGESGIPVEAEGQEVVVRGVALAE